jgi:multiple sugar transport system ATP-binding protein
MNLLPLRRDGLTVADTGWPLPLDERGRRLAETVRADDLVAGVRPERVTIQPAGGAGLSAVVDYREPRGDVDVIIASARSTVIVAEVPGPSRYRAKDQISLAFSESHIHLFAGPGGRNLEVAA